MTNLRDKLITKAGLPELEPGKKLTDSEKAAIRKDNERISNQAKQAAYEHQDADIRGGQRPVVQEVADRIKQRLQEGDISKK